MPDGESIRGDESIVSATSMDAWRGSVRGGTDWNTSSSDRRCMSEGEECSRSWMVCHDGAPDQVRDVDGYFKLFELALFAGRRP